MNEGSEGEQRELFALARAVSTTDSDEQHGLDPGFADVDPRAVANPPPYLDMDEADDRPRVSNAEIAASRQLCSAADRRTVDDRDANERESAFEFNGAEGQGDATN